MLRSVSIKYVSSPLLLAIGEQIDKHTYLRRCWKCLRRKRWCQILGALFVLDCNLFNFALGGFVIIIEVDFADDVL